MPRYPVNRPDPGSKCWQFVLEDQAYFDAPMAFQGYVSFCAWIATPRDQTAVNSFYRIRGYVQFPSVRHRSLLERRYSRVARWIPCDILNQEVFRFFVVRPIPIGSIRAHYGMPNADRSKPFVPVSMERVGLNTPVVDLHQQWLQRMLSMEVDMFKATFQQEDAPVGGDPLVDMAIDDARLAFDREQRRYGYFDDE